MSQEVALEEDQFSTSAVIPDGIRCPDGITAARLALGRAGSGMPTRAHLNFVLDHARARDAVHIPIDFHSLEKSLAELNLSSFHVESSARDRHTYLLRPDLGRRLSSRSRTMLEEQQISAPDIVLVIGDGLSSAAVQFGTHPLLVKLVPRLQSMRLSIGPLIFASQARVALGDDIGQAMGARLVIVLIGERPGLTAVDSLGAYMTLRPSLGRSDADRNCVSNIRPGGLDPNQAALKLAWLTERAFSSGVTGVQLKDESDLNYLPKKSHRIPSQ